MIWTPPVYHLEQGVCLLLLLTLALVLPGERHLPAVGDASPTTGSSVALSCTHSAAGTYVEVASAQEADAAQALPATRAQVPGRHADVASSSNGEMPPVRYRAAAACTPQAAAPAAHLSHRILAAPPPAFQRPASILAELSTVVLTT